MGIWQAVVLAIIQGITEFIPVSSSAHLLLIPLFVGWPEQGISFDITLHLGTLTAVLLYFRKEIFSLANPLNPLTQKIALATIPAGLAAMMLDGPIEAYLRSTNITTLVIAISTIVFGLLLGFGQYQEKNLIHKVRNYHLVTYTQALLIGLAQSLALIPGASRLGVTMTAGLLLGLPRRVAAEFSFLLSIPIILLSAAKTGLDLYKDPSLINSDLNYYLIGFGVSAIVAIASMNLFIKLIEKIGVMPFVVYRIILGITLLIYFY